MKSMKKNAETSNAELRKFDSPTETHSVLLILTELL